MGNYENESMIIVCASITIIAITGYPLTYVCRFHSTINLLFDSVEKLI